MAVARRSFTTFSLSFLDVMACGFGAIVLLFLIINHASDAQYKLVNHDQLAEVSLLEEEVKTGQEQRVKIRNTISEIDQQLAEAQGLASRIIEQTRVHQQELADLSQDSMARRDHIKQLQTDLESAAREQKRLAAEAAKKPGDSVRKIAGEGTRQYLTGLNLGGRHPLILLDASASMLDESIVNIIRLRNMPESARKKSAKWRRSVATAEWLAAQLPRTAEFQLYTFNTSVAASISGTLGSWLPLRDPAQLNQAVENLDTIVPGGGTSLANVFLEVAKLSPKPDNIYLITDGLPTQGQRATTGTVSGKQRLKLFNEAMRALPSGIPVNIILAPMEGDPMAASAFWRLAQATRGSFMSPSKDWP